MTEWPKVHDWKSCVLARVPRVRIPLSPPAKQEGSAHTGDPVAEGDGASICTSVCTPLDEADLERRIVDAELAGRVTVADALAKHLEKLRDDRARDASAAMTSLVDERARRERKR